MTRKLSPDRIRRHRARSTPDTVQIHIYPYNDFMQMKYYKWLEDFKKAMEIKHGGPVRIEVFSEESFRTYDLLYTATVVKEK